MNEQEKLEKLNVEVCATEAELHHLEQQQKIMAKEAALLNRRQRTRRLCTRGGMLESFLCEPERLSDAQVMSLLSLAFHTSVVRDRLNAYLSPPSSEE